MLQKLNATSNLVFIPIFILSFFALNYGLQNIVYGSTGYNDIALQKESEREIFWNSSFGVTLKAVLDIVTISMLLYFSLLLSSKKIKFLTILWVVIFSYFSFILQMVFEAIIINSYQGSNIPIDLEDFSFLSIYYFLDVFKIGTPTELKYLLQTLSVFELLFMFLLMFSLQTKAKLEGNFVLKIVIVGYFIPLLIWLMVISVVSLLYIS
jgi:hypothetical protein